jgi:hypothetical protein
MSRTHKDYVQRNHKYHRDAPYWKYRWWLKHGDSETRRLHNRRLRRRCNLAVYLGKEPPEWVRDLPWIWW